MNIQDQLSTLGISGKPYRNGQEILITCPFHSPDRHPSCSVNLQTGVWICYAGCGGGDWLDFIERIRKDPEYAPFDPTTSSAQPKKPVLKSLLERGFSREILQKWDIGWDTEVKGMRLPVYSRTGALQGLIWRFPVGVQPKYRYQLGFERSKTLYGLWRLSTKITQVVLVEGPLDAIWVQEAGIAALAILGSSLSEQQAHIIQELRPNRVLLCFDNDAAGKQATSGAVGLLQREGCWVYKVRLPAKIKDVQEVENAKVVDVLANIELCVNGKGMLHPRYKRWERTSQAPNGNGIWKG